MELRRHLHPPLRTPRLNRNTTKEEGVAVVPVAVAAEGATAVAPTAAPASSVGAPGTRTPLRHGRADTTPGWGSCTPTPCLCRAPSSLAPSAPVRRRTRPS